MPTIKYLINVRLEFDSSENRDAVYTKMKTSLGTAKSSNPWEKGQITKDEYTSPDITQESV